jgi:hypothetical protein
MAQSPRLPERTVDDNSGVRGNSLAAEFGGTNALGEAVGASYEQTSPPPNASAAPKGNTANVFTGLCEALNTWQQGLVKDGTYTKADVYEIQFIPASMADAQLKKPGSVDQSHTPMQTGSTAKLQLDPETNVLNVTGRTVSVQAGTQIIQFIDQVVRGSTYIGNQQLYQIDELTDEVKKNPAAVDRPIAWYKISIQATDLGPDPKRNDHAYKMTYIVTPYGINETRSQYFPRTKFRGVQKNYDYWFTGNNTSILNYEQQLNTLYYQVISEGLPLARSSAETNPYNLYKRSYQNKSGQSDQYASGSANEPAANLADFLYTPEDFIKIDLKIIGDPAWIPQGEAAGGVTANNFSFAAFNSDDGINFDAQEIAFSVTFNQPEDYNLDTGLMEVASNFKKQNGEYGRNYPKQAQVYRCSHVKSVFSKGRFEQNLTGDLYADIPKEGATSGISDQNRPRTGPTSAQTRAADEVIAQSIQTNRVGSSLATEFGGQDELALATGSAVYNDDSTPATPSANSTPLPAPPAQPSTSDADIVPTTSVPTPSTADIANSPNDGVKEKLALAASYEERAATARAAGELSNAATLARLAQNSRENAAADAKFGAPPNVKPLQITARET